MKKLIFATNNKHKLEEVRAALEGKVEIVSLAEAGLEGEIPETADTLQGNALQKAQWVWERISGQWSVVSGQLADASSAAPAQLTTDNQQLTTHYDGVFADDTGLEVDALGGAPGVYSARYAGEHCSFDDNVNKLLAALDGVENRKADFRTVICLLEFGSRSSEVGGNAAASENTEPQNQPSELFFEGRVDGQILTERHSSGEGFGYDPIFMPDRFALSFAEMPIEVKNRISHRGLAVAKLAEYLSR